MTIVAGFCVREGVLICADTLHTGTGHNVYDPKIILSPHMKIGRAVFSYSGHSFLAKGTVQRCIESLCASSSAAVRTPAQAAAIVQQTIDRQYRSHVCAQPDPNTDSIYQLMFSVAVKGHAPELYTTWQGEVNHCDSYDFIGIGSYVGRLLVDPIFQANLSVSHLESIASYAIVKAKEAAQGVGGPTNAVLLKPDGTTEEILPVTTASGEGVFALFHFAVQRLFLSLIDWDDKDFNQALDDFGKMMEHVRVAGNLNDAGRKNPTPRHFMGSNVPTRQLIPRPTIYDPSGRKP